MTLPKYFLLNGELGSFKSGLSQSDLLLDWMSGSLEIRWRSSGTRIPFYPAQYSRLFSFFQAFQEDKSWIPDERSLALLLTKLIQGNRLFKGVDIRFYLKPGTNLHEPADLLILSLIHPEELFVLNDQGLVIGPAEPQQHPGMSYLHKMSFNQIFTRQWKQQAYEKELDALYLTGTENQLLETMDSNIYLIKGNKLFTPSNDHFLFPWGIQDSIQKACLNLGLSYSPTTSLLSDHLNQADEVFLADDYRGIRWVMGHQNKRFFRKNSQKIMKLINLEWENSDQLSIGSSG